MPSPNGTATSIATIRRRCCRPRSCGCRSARAEGTSRCRSACRVDQSVELRKLQRAAEQDEQDQRADEERCRRPRAEDDAHRALACPAPSALPWRSSTVSTCGRDPLDAAVRFARLMVLETRSAGRPPGGTAAGRRSSRRVYMAAQASLVAWIRSAGSRRSRPSADRGETLRRTGRSRRTRRRPGSRRPWRC